MKQKIIFIEDDLPTIDIYEDVFKKAGFDIEIVNSGREGLEILKKIKTGKKMKPDLVLLDLILPDINGIEVLRDARADGELKNISFFVFTNYTDPALEQESRKLGVEGYLVKTGYTPSKLVQIIQEWFDKPQETKI